MTGSVKRELPFCALCVAHHDPCAVALRVYEANKEFWGDMCMSLEQWNKEQRIMMKISPEYEEIPTVNLDYC